MHIERTTLFNLRAETINGFKGCFSSAYEDIKCRLGCKEIDNLSHIYCCKVINQYIHPTEINVGLIYQDIDQQKSAVKEFILREKIRSNLILTDSASQGGSEILDTSTPAASAARGAGERHGERDSFVYP